MACPCLWLCRYTVTLSLCTLSLCTNLGCCGCWRCCVIVPLSPKYCFPRSIAARPDARAADVVAADDVAVAAAVALMLLLLLLLLLRCCCCCCCCCCADVVAVAAAVALMLLLMLWLWLWLSSVQCPSYAREVLTRAGQTAHSGRWRTKT